MKKVKKESKIITLDTETYGLTGALKRIAIYDGEKVYYGYKFTDVELILNNYSLIYDVHVYIHNIEFDIRKIPEVFESKRIRWERCLLINGKLATVACKKYTMHDSFKILPMSLDKLSGKKGFDVEHGKLDLWREVKKKYGNKYKDKGDYFLRCDRDDPLYIEYLGYDVISLYEVLEKLIEISKLSVDDFVRCVSTSSLSRFIFKNGYGGKIFKHKEIAQSDYEVMCTYKWEQDLEMEEYCREAYFGGRVEVFKPILDRPGYHYDVNSLYPYVMMCQPEYPVGAPEELTTDATIRKCFADWQEYHRGLGLVNCLVWIPEQNIPPLPVKLRGKLTFPTGELWGCWTFEELDYAIKNCGVVVKRFEVCYYFRRTYPVFENFIGTMYGLKEKGAETGNEALRNFGKLLMNVGYGYTGMRRDDKTKLVKYEDSVKYDNVIYKDMEMGYAEVPTEVKAEYIQVQIAAYVTSRARLVLLDAMRKLESLGGNIYYCDTDSIVTDIRMPDDMVDKYRLGAWDLEEEPVRGIFLRPKVYVEQIADKKDNIKFKGVTKETQKDMCYDFYAELLKLLQKGDKKSIKIEKNRTVLRSVMYMHKKGLDPLYFEQRDKEMKLKTIEKRIINYNLNYTKPHHFETTKDAEEFNKMK